MGPVVALAMVTVAFRLLNDVVSPVFTRVGLLSWEGDLNECDESSESLLPPVLMI